MAGRNASSQGLGGTCTPTDRHVRQVASKCVVTLPTATLMCSFASNNQVPAVSTADTGYRLV